ncbi:uncharacterized protein LOC125501286 [Athalia rosae]|uniref:uncharacterized protein LOC125501286 n=1 Tax=Athalia rosae TaxID=37344 RepID=UPI00203381B5|nr:uncharacterized protein LOC125501286 [Athalia rosae]
MRVLNFLAMTYLTISQVRCVTAYGHVLGSNKILFERNENKLVEFFTEFQREVVHFDSRQIMCIGDSTDQLNLLRPLMNENAYYLAKNVTEGVKSITLDSYSQDFVFLFLTSVEDSYVKSILGNIHKFFRMHFFFVYQGFATDDEIDMVLDTVSEKPGNIYTMNFPRIFLHHDEGKVKLYVREFSINCLPELALLMNFSSNATFEKVREFYGSAWDHKGCPGLILTRYSPPRMILETDSEGELQITGGSEGIMTLTIAKVLNALPKVSLIALSNRLVRPKILTVVAVANWKEMLLAVDHIRFRYRETSRITSVTYSAAYSKQCAVWVVPIIPKWNYVIFVGEFTMESWIVIAATFFIFVAISSFIRSRSQPRIGSHRAMQFCGTIMDLYSLSLGNPLPEQSMAGGLKALGLIFLWYSLIITTAYKGSLSSLITVGHGRSAITDTEGILKANLSMGGDIPNLQLIQDLASNSEIFQEIATRYEIWNDSMAAIRRVAFDKDFAFVTSRSDLYYNMEMYLKTNEVPPLFDVIDDCVMTFDTGTIVSKNVRLLKSVDNVILRLTESGLMKYWQIQDLHQSPGLGMKFKNPADSGYETTKVHKLLVICSVPTIASMFLFFAELIHHRFTPHGSH